MQQLGRPVAAFEPSVRCVRRTLASLCIAASAATTMTALAAVTAVAEQVHGQHPHDEDYPNPVA